MLKRKKTVKFVSQIIPSIEIFFFKAIITFLFYFIFFIGDMLISLERAKFSI